MKTITGVILITALVAGCTKDCDELPGRSLPRSLAQKGNYLTVSLLKEGMLLDVAETKFAGNPEEGTLEAFDRDITISFLEAGAYWQVNNLTNKKPDSLNLSIVHKEQAWCSHCSYYNGNYVLVVESRVKGVLKDKVLGINKSLNKNKTTSYSYTVTDNSEQQDRFVILLK